MWREAFGSVCCELPRELTPAAVVVEEHRRTPKQQREGELLGKGHVGQPQRAGVVAGGTRRSPERSTDGVGKALGWELSLSKGW